MLESLRVVNLLRLAHQKKIIALNLPAQWVDSEFLTITQGQDTPRLREEISAIVTLLNLYTSQETP